MNRREMFTRIAGVVAASGVVAPSAVSLVSAEPMPALIVFELPHDVDPYETNTLNFFASWADAVKGTAFEHVRAVMLEGGMKLTVLDAHGRVLNERIDTENKS